MDAKPDCVLNHAQKECMAMKLHTIEAREVPFLPGFARF
jgi:hypothetical protein